MPHFRDENLNHVSYAAEVLKVLEKIPKYKLVVLDNTKPGITRNYGSIYQDFQEDIYNALKEGLKKLKNTIK